MKIPLTIKQLIWLLIAVLCAAFLLAGLTQLILQLGKNGGDWVDALISSLGNIIGGVIGGVVAVIVAAYQVNKTLDIENKKQLLTTLTFLKLIREELRDNITVLESALPYKPEKFLSLQFQLSDDVWKSIMVNISVSDKLLVLLNVSYRKISYLKAIDVSKLDDDLIRSTKDQINQILSDLNREITNTSDRLGLKATLEGN